MKNDPYFKFIAVAIVAGILCAAASVARASDVCAPVYVTARAPRWMAVLHRGFVRFTPPALLVAPTVPVVLPPSLPAPAMVTLRILR